MGILGGLCGLTWDVAWEHFEKTALSLHSVTVESLGNVMSTLLGFRV